MTEAMAGPVDLTTGRPLRPGDRVWAWYLGDAFEATIVEYWLDRRVYKLGLIRADNGQPEERNWDAVRLIDPTTPTERVRS